MKKGIHWQCDEVLFLIVDLKAHFERDVDHIYESNDPKFK